VDYYGYSPVDTMTIDRKRELFVMFLRENKLDNYLICNSSSTIQQDNTLKYERIDRYTVSLLTCEDLKRLCKFCNLHGLMIWFRNGQLCIGYSHVSNMRLQAYEKEGETV